MLQEWPRPPCTTERQSKNSTEDEFTTHEREPRKTTTIFFTKNNVRAITTTPLFSTHVQPTLFSTPTCQRLTSRSPTSAGLDVVSQIKCSAERRMCEERRLKVCTHNEHNSSSKIFSIQAHRQFIQTAFHTCKGSLTCAESLVQGPAQRLSCTKLVQRESIFFF